MKRLLLPLIAALALPTAIYSSTKIEPEPKSQILNNPFERIGKEAKFNCKEFGEESCFSRFIAMSACSFSQSIRRQLVRLTEFFAISFIKVNRVYKATLVGRGCCSVGL